MDCRSKDIEAPSKGNPEELEYYAASSAASSWSSPSASDECISSLEHDEAESTREDENKAKALICRNLPGAEYDGVDE